VSEIGEPASGSADASGASFVLIAGGGPVGAVLALDLAHRGVSSVLVDERTAIAHRPKAQLTNTRSMEHLRRLGIADRLRDAALLPADWPMTIVFTETLVGREIHRFEGQGVGQLRDRPEFNEPPQRVPQYVVEEVLRDAIAARPEVRTRFGHRLVAFEETPSGVRATLEPSEGGPSETVRSSWLIGCDGAASTVRRQLGIDVDGHRGVRLQMGVFFRSTQLATLHDKGPAVFYFALNRDAIGLLGPVDDQGSWWFQTSSFPADTDPDSVDVAALLRGAVGCDFEFEVTEVVPWRINVVLADHYGRRRVWMAGDAVHQHPPTGGFGMNNGICEAADLAWKLAAVHQGWGGEHLVESYEAERRPVARRVIDEAVANALGLAATFAPVEEGRIPDAAEIAANTAREWSSLGVQLGYRYAGSPIVVGDGAPEPAWDPSDYVPSAWPGCLLPHRWLADDESLYDRLGPGFTLLVIADHEGQSIEAFVGAAEAIGLPLEVLRIDDESYAEVCAARFVLARPDQHVAWRGDRPPPDPGEVLDIVRGAITRGP
jgi:2-polyprenyl-6-methoxyphenol hydroxylase-like FAD-dependent oxidoreductase